MRAPRVPQVGAIALALLVCGCVFIALAGPAVSLRVRTQALHQLLGLVGSLDTSVETEATWASYTSAYYAGHPQNLSRDDFRSSTIFIGDGLAATPLPIAAGSWGGLTTGQYRVISGKNVGSPGITPQLEVTYRDPLTSNIRLVAGHLTGTPLPPRSRGGRGYVPDGRALQAASWVPARAGRLVGPGPARGHRDRARA